ncbi:sialidase family protein [Mumia quercus]|uniref:sialidase family protein n=1 Tax=Mumia quercus TaxID=2976125 RepID=UPI0021CEA7EF|nr:sialidase family protein [Mumia quercus]
MQIGRRPRLAAFLATSLGGALVAGALAFAPGSAVGETTPAAPAPSPLGWASVNLVPDLVQVGHGLAAADGRTVVGVASGWWESASIPKSVLRMSTDGGRTFGAPRDLSGYPLAVAVEGERAWLVSSPGGPSPELVVETWGVGGSTPLTTFRTSLPNVPQDAAITVSGDDVVVAAGLSGGALVSLASGDAGVTFGERVQVTTDWAVGIDAAVAAGRTVLAYGVRPGGDFDVEVRTSDDTGATWSSGTLVGADATKSPSLAVGTHGFSLGVVRSGRVAVLSSADGKTWDAGTSVAPVPAGEINSSVAAHGDTVYATSDGTRIYASTAGSDWQQLPSPAPLGTMFPSLPPGDIDGFVATDDGVGVLNLGVLVRGYQDTRAPAVRFTAVPPAITTVARHLVRFTSTDPDSPGAWSRYECAYGSNEFRPCTSPHDLAEWYPHLHDAAQSLRVRAVDAAGHVSAVATARWILDEAAPYNVFAAAKSNVTLSSRASFRWGADDPESGVASYDLRWSSTSQKASRMSRSWRTRSAVKTTSGSFGVARGKIVCLQVRARDRAGRVSAWSRTECVARTYDDRGLARSGSTKKLRHKRFVDGSATRIRSGGEVRLREVRRGSDVVVVFKREPGRRGFTIRRPGVSKDYVDTAGRVKYRVVRMAAEPRQRRAGTLRISGDGVLDGIAVLPRWAR